MMAKTKNINVSKEWLYEMYVLQEKTTKDIGLLLNITAVSVIYHMKKFGIPVRSRSEQKSGNKNPAFGKQNKWGKHTEETKRLISDKVPKGKRHFRYKEPNDRIETLNGQIRNCYQYKIWRNEILERDGYKCVMCGFQNDLHVDHIFPFADIKKKYDISSLKDAINCSAFWKKENGRILCKNCHMLTETWGPRKK